MAKISQNDLDKLNNLAVRDPQAALVLLREYQAQYQGDPNCHGNCGGALIDIGWDLGQRALTEEGVQQIEDLLNIDWASRTAYLRYNLANGYDALRRFDEQRTGKKDPDNEWLLKAKQAYRQTIAEEVSLDKDRRVELWVNYGNCLSCLGRSVEAIAAYDQALRLAPDHAMALGNYGVELSYFANVAENAMFLSHALDALNKALERDNLVQLGGSGARPAFECAKARLDAQMAGRNAQRPQAQTPHLPTEEPLRAYMEFCRKHRLFLNFCLRCQSCPDFAHDSVGFPLTTALDDNTTFVRLARVVNSIKEQYAFARFLPFQAVQPSLDTIPIDRMTSYVDNLDYGVYGTRVASVKLAFGAAYDVFDKIAHFINSYVKLGLKPGPQLKFAVDGSLWRKKGASTLRDELLRLQIWHLFGLYDVARDLFVDSNHKVPDGDMAHFRHTRNRLTHEYIIPHVEGMHWEPQADEPQCHIYYRDLVKQTIEVLQLVRAAVIYLIAFIDQQERGKDDATTGPVGALPITPYDASLFAHGLDRA